LVIAIGLALAISRGLSLILEAVLLKHGFILQKEYILKIVSPNYPGRAKPLKSGNPEVYEKGENHGKP
jgi:hypothetical protein